MSQRPRSSQQSQGRQSQGGVDVADYNVIALAERAVHFCLLHAGAHNSPIKHLDLKKIIFPDVRMDESFKLAKKMLKETFGYELVELSSKGKSYVLVSCIKNVGHTTLPRSAEGYMNLLLLVLTFIFMNRGEVEIKIMLKFLAQVGIGIDRPHPYFGDVADLIYKQNPGFVRDLYLQRTEKEQGIFFEWGERAKAEVDPRAALQFVCEVLESDVDEWRLHLQDCDKMDQERAEITGAVAGAK